MCPELISRSPDLWKLWEEGHVMELKGEYLLVHHIPYLNAKGEIDRGTLVTYVNQSGGIAIKPNDHVVQFMGDFPRRKNGAEVQALKHPSDHSGELCTGLFVNHWFSNKPENGFDNYYEKVTSYIRVISAPAKSINPELDERSFQWIESKEADSPFQYPDTNAGRATIHPITAKLGNLKIAIVGLGGTGSYILDLVAKTPVAEIHLFDGDVYLQHNAFRAPGATPKNKFLEHYKKTDYFQEIYTGIHRSIFSHPENIEDANLHQLAGLDFVFLSMDAGPIKGAIVAYLEENRIPFVDAGIGMEEVDRQLTGQVRTTLNTPEKRDHFRKRVSFADEKENLYDRNIQIADLNSLNAAFAVIRWKKLYGFYLDQEGEFTSVFSINTNEIFNADHST